MQRLQARHGLACGPGCTRPQKGRRRRPEFDLVVDQIEGDAQLGRHAPSIIDRLGCTAAVFAFAPQAHHDADHVVALLDQQGGGHRAIHAALMATTTRSCPGTAGRTEAFTKASP